MLIGFMGTGKTVVGSRLAERLGYAFADTDHLLEEREGLTIPEIFKKQGERYFRERERTVVEEVSQREKVVISCGGGVVTDPRNTEALKKKGIMICLTAPPSVIYERVRRTRRRPLLEVDDPVAQIRRLLQKREKWYSAADYTIDTSGGDIGWVVEMILSKVSLPKAEREGKGK